MSPSRSLPNRKFGPSTTALARRQSNDDAIKELAGRQAEQSQVRGISNHGVHAQVAEQFGFALGPSQRGRRGFRPQQDNRVRIKGEHRHRTAHLPRLLLQAFDQPRVPAMDAVEVPDGDRSLGQRRGKAVQRPNQVFQLNPQTPAARLGTRDFRRNSLGGCLMGCKISRPRHGGGAGMPCHGQTVPANRPDSNGSCRLG